MESGWNKNGAGLRFGRVLARSSSEFEAPFVGCLRRWESADVAVARPAWINTYVPVREKKLVKAPTIDDTSDFCSEPSLARRFLVSVRGVRSVE